MGEGAEVRKAFDGPTVEHDELISFFEARIAEEYSRSSDASESASKTSDFLDKTGLNSQAASWGKTILKKLPKKDGQAKAMDIIRSMKAMLPMLENHVGGQGTAEMFPEDEPSKPKAEAGMNSPETQPEPTEDPDEELATFADEEVDEETAEFNAEVDEVMDEAEPEPKQADPFENDAHGRGMHDYAEGVARDDNPFDETLMKHGLWNTGWDEAAELDNTETGRGMENVVKPAFGGAE